MKLKINIDGREYEADIEVLEEERHEIPGQAATRSAPKARGAGVAPPDAGSAPTPSGNDDKVCKSSIVGIVVRILVSVGQNVSVGDPLLVLEAMKMESNVISPLSGRVKSIAVAAGESVKRGQVLVEFE